MDLALDRDDNVEKRGVRSSMKILKKDAYVVAAAPAFVFLSVYFYEWGRFSFYKVPPLFLSLPTTRVLVAGVAIAVFFITMFSFLRGIILRMRGAGKLSSVLSAFLATYLLFGFPLALISVSYKALLSTFVLPVVLVVLGELGALFDRIHVKSANKGAAAPTEDSAVAEDPLAEPGGVAFLSLYGLFLIFCFGNGQERMIRGNVCLGERIVVATYGDQLILKGFNKVSGEIDESVHFHPLAATEVKACRPSIVGGGGYHGLP
ncbi:hypothetical protein ABB28_08955 [Stenotrophomonas chelatiphaga]|uniref:Transmembrane protein n=1 Tax=Stenotrophomonas chelatiphaga TaxID=517011 RepID=A0A0R0CVH2_9GAMM|nr:hypothetical protein [Stenotrophomonas chelatiphaga]KRG73836.1 hypothetical protein ABB28_08955 [Stenotrophomonas chelatiphaga]